MRRSASSQIRRPYSNESACARRGLPQMHERHRSAPLGSVEAPRSGISSVQVGIFAAACGLAVANIYYSQPLIGLIAPALGLHPGLAGLIVTLIQLGYGVGLLLVVPLSDVRENR